MTTPKPPPAKGLRGLAAFGEDAVLLGMTEESVEDIMAAEAQPGCARNPAPEGDPL